MRGDGNKTRLIDESSFTGDAEGMEKIKQGCEDVDHIIMIPTRSLLFQLVAPLCVSLLIEKGMIGPNETQLCGTSLRFEKDETTVKNHTLT